MATNAEKPPEIDEATAKKAANRFDIRRIIGGVFLVYGVILTVVGIVGSDDREDQGGRDQREPVDRPGDARGRRDDGGLGADAPGGAERAAIAGVVCLHGLGRAPADWAAVGPGLEAFGPVACPSLPREPAPALAAAREAVAAAGDGAVVVGHSMGAVIGAARRGRAPAIGARRRARRLLLPARAQRADARGERRRLRAPPAAFVREARGRGAPGPGSRRGGVGALRSLARLGVRPAGFDALADAVRAPVLVVHARDDHHVPLDFALAAAGRRPGWSVRVLARGGHHPHVADPEGWLRAVAPWLDAV